MNVITDGAWKSILYNVSYQKQKTEECPMKKLTAVLLALVMVLSLSFASAAELTLTFPEINADAGLVCDLLR